MSDVSGGPLPPEPGGEEMREGRPEEQKAGPASTGVAWGAIFLLLGIALVVIFAVQNTNPVPVEFLWMEGEFPLAMIILVTVGVIIVLTELAGLTYRRRRRRRQAEREELRRLRSS